jgi:hypothetical protein
MSKEIYLMLFISLFFISSCSHLGTLTFYDYQLVENDESVPANRIVPNLFANFTFEMTQYWHIYKEPYNLVLSITDYENKYKSIQINTIESQLADKIINLLNLVENISLSRIGMPLIIFSESHLVEFRNDGIVLLQKNDLYKIRHVSIITSKLGFNHNDVKRFTIKINMQIRDFDDNIINVDKIFIFKQNVRKEKNYLTV